MSTLVQLYTQEEYDYLVLRVKEYLDKGYTKSETARVFDVPYNLVNNIVRRNRFSYTVKPVPVGVVSGKIRYRRTKAELEIAKEQAREAQERRKEAIEKFNERDMHRAAKELRTKPRKVVGHPHPKQVEVRTPPARKTPATKPLKIKEVREEPAEEKKESTIIKEEDYHSEVDEMINKIRDIKLTDEDKDFVIRKALGRVYNP